MRRTMDEFGTQLDRSRFAGGVQRIGAAAYSIARLKNDGIDTAFVQTPCRCESRGAGADYGHDCFQVSHCRRRSRSSRQRPGKQTIETRARRRYPSIPDQNARAARILALIRAIPPGFVQTYGDVDPQAPRLVGHVLATTSHTVPWHRVVRADGSMTQGRKQRERLRKEGVPFKGGRVDIRVARWPRGAKLVKIIIRKTR